MHVPFCRRKCIYCDFYSVGEKFISNEFLKALACEFEARKAEIEEAGEVTLYIGGGTPSLLSPGEIGEIRNWIQQPVTEFTIEVNPDDVTEEKAQGWKKAGVNRISMGVQSLVDSELKAIGRRHDAKGARDAYKILRNHFDNISLDLMFGLPGQTIESLRITLEEFVKMKPKHISAYSLMYEERTALTRQRDKGIIEETPEEDSVRMFELINDILGGAGYERYEISNFSMPGFRSRHNSNYWIGIPYLGLGPSAHSYDGDRIRRYNPADLKSYISFYKSFRDRIERQACEDEESKNGVISFFEEERLSDNELREEMIMTRLRTSEGIDLNEFETRFKEEERRKIEAKARSFIKSGDLEVKGNRIRLTPAGVMISDEIISSLF